MGIWAIHLENSGVPSPPHSLHSSLDPAQFSSSLRWLSGCGWFVRSREGPVDLQVDRPPLVEIPYHPAAAPHLARVPRWAIRGPDCAHMPPPNTLPRDVTADRLDH